MQKKYLENYRANKRLIERNRKKIGEEQLRDIPVVAGKVKGSSSEFPYIERRFGVQMDDPVEAERQRRRMQLLREDNERAETEMRTAERLVSGITDITEREILTLYYLDGEKKPTQSSIADAVGYTQGRVSQIIAKYLKD